MIKKLASAGERFMEETFKITRNIFQGLVISLLLSTLILKLSWPDVSVVTAFATKVLGNELIMRGLMYAFPVLLGIVVLFMPFSAFFLYWCSAAFACYYLVSLPLEALLLLILLGVPALLNRFKIVNYPDVRIILAVGALLLGFITYLFVTTDIFLIEHLIVKILFLLPLIHVLSMPPGSDSQSRFQSEV